MTKHKKESEESGWCFAILNGKLVELWFERKKGKLNIFAHAYVKRSEFKTKSEHKMIDTDTAKYHFSWRNGVYKDLNTGEKFKPRKPNWMN
ncbi:MAG: hypothetical protein AAB590_03990 [Patescibacteria group bacterium]